MKEIYNYIVRHSIWVILILVAFWLLKPQMPEINTLLLITIVEAIAIALSGLASYAYTKVDFTRTGVNSNLGFIFLGVHICVGLVVLGVYIAQFAG
jgi:hypothetical protein